MARQAQIVDIAIVGGGVAGCGCAYRLSKHYPDKRIHVFEMDDRFGGRLSSIASPDWSAPLERGAMFFSDTQHYVAGLAKHFGLRRTLVQWRRNQHYVRGQWLTDAAFVSSDHVPFALRADERGKSPHQLMMHALAKIIPDFHLLWPFTTEGRYGDVFSARQYLRRVEAQGRPLWAWGMRPLLADVLSQEAFALISAAFGSAATFGDVNAYDGIATLMSELHPSAQYYILSDGFDQLPLALKRASAPNARFFNQSKLSRVTTLRGTFRLFFDRAGGQDVVETTSLILALPKRAIELVAFDEALVGPQFFVDLAAIRAVPACKLFLTFKNIWWAHDPNSPLDGEGCEIAASYTDLPIRQCYYYNRPGVDGRALLMAAYADDAAVMCWSDLARGPSERSGQGIVPADDALVQFARRQLQLMHPGMVVPQPIEAFFVDWTRDPYGGGWHAWTPQARSWEVRARLRKPNAERSFFICGEAVAELQGWTEGALANMEVLLKDHFNVPPPAWVDETYVPET